MDKIQILALLQQTLVDVGESDADAIRLAALELAVSNITPPSEHAPFDIQDLTNRISAAWGLDYATILNEAAVTYADTTLSAPEVLAEIANNLSN